MTSRIGAIRMCPFEPGWRNGRLGGLKSPFPQGSVGSSPTPGILIASRSLLGSSAERARSQRRNAARRRAAGGATPARRRSKTSGGRRNAGAERVRSIVSLWRGGACPWWRATRGGGGRRRRKRGAGAIDRHGEVAAGGGAEDVAGAGEELGAIGDVVAEGRAGDEERALAAEQARIEGLDHA